MKLILNIRPIFFLVFDMTQQGFELRKQRDALSSHYLTTPMRWMMLFLKGFAKFFYYWYLILQIYHG